MTTETGAPAGDIAAPADQSEEISLSDARQMIDAMYAEDEKKPAESAEPATAEPELSKDDSAPETEPAEQTEEADPEEIPSIEPPRSWTKAEKERFQSLPRETQEYLSHREQERETALRRSQNEIAEQRKAIEAKLSEADKVKQQYEAQLPALMQSLQDAQQAAFSDIKTMDDVVKLQAEDPFRFQAWQVHQMRIQAAKAETDRVSQDKQTAEQKFWADHVQKEDALAQEFIPDLADKTKGKALRDRVANELLPDLGFKQDELASLANGKEKLSIFDHRIQRLLADSLKLRDIQNAPRAVVKPNLPPVQKPGTTRPAGSVESESIRALEAKLNQSGSEADAWALLQAREKARTRRAS